MKWFGSENKKNDLMFSNLTLIYLPTYTQKLTIAILFTVN